MKGCIGPKWNHWNSNNTYLLTVYVTVLQYFVLKFAIYLGLYLSFTGLFYFKMFARLLRLECTAYLHLMPLWHLSNSSRSRWSQLISANTKFILTSFIYGLSKCMLRVRPLTAEKSTTAKIAPIRHIGFVTARAHYVFCVRAHLPKSFNSGLLPLHSKPVALFLYVINIVCLTMIQMYQVTKII